MAYLQAFWVVFDGRGSACVEDVSMEAAKEQAAKLTNCAVLDIKTLPYPAQPRISEKKSDCPDFCFSPKECAGRMACPKSHACDD
jgi:hypothetical protein